MVIDEGAECVFGFVLHLQDLGSWFCMVCDSLL